VDQEILINNLDIVSEKEKSALDIMSDMFGEKVLSESNDLAKELTHALLEIDWGRIGISAGIGTIAGFCIGIIITKMYYNYERKQLFANQHPDPAHGCGCTIVGITTGIGVITGVIIGYLQQK